MTVGTLRRSVELKLLLLMLLWWPAWLPMVIYWDMMHGSSVKACCIAHA